MTFCKDYTGGQDTYEPHGGLAASVSLRVEERIGVKVADRKELQQCICFASLLGFTLKYDF